MRAHAKAGRKAEAAALADSVGDLVEAAFDWDSLMTAEARREAGERYAAAGDWTNACLALRKSLEVRVALQALPGPPSQPLTDALFCCVYRRRWRRCAGGVTAAPPPSRSFSTPRWKTASAPTNTTPTATAATRGRTRKAVAAGQGRRTGRTPA